MIWRCVAAVLFCSLAISSVGCNEARKAKARGIEKMQERQYGPAIHQFDKAIAADSGDAELYYYRAFAWMSLQDARKALFDVEESLRLNPQYTDARILRGHARTELGDLDQAIAELNDVLRQFPDKEQVYQSRGMTLMARGEYKLALADFDHMITHNPEQGQGYNNRAWLRATARDDSIRDGKQAIADATKAAELQDGQQEAVYAILDTLAAAHAEAGQFDKAVEQQQLAIDQAPSRDVAPMKARLELYKAGKPYRLSVGRAH